MSDMIDLDSSKYPALRIGDLVAKIPLFQGGMGVGISLSSLAGAVAKLGGVGVISTAQIGFQEKDFADDPIEANMHAIDKHVKRAKEISNNGIIGVNIMVATRYYERYVKQAVASGVDIIISGAGLPMDLPKLTKGSNVKIIPIVSSKKAAKIILTSWFRKEQRLPDAVIIEGPKAGGHLGFHREDLDTLTDEMYDEEIKNTIQFVREFGEEHNAYIPVVCAGGIYENSGVNHVMELGADGIQVGSLFVTTEECDADIRYKEAYVNCKKDDIVIVKSPVGLPGRAIRNEFLAKVESCKEPITKCFQCIKSCKPKESMYCITEALINAAKGNIEKALLFCGAEAYRQNRITNVQSVIKELFTKQPV